MNVWFYVFKEYEGVYIGGLFVVMVIKIGMIGFVGGMDIFIIWWFLCGYK